MKKWMKTPITYYGGKQVLVKHLLGLIPPHKLYCEPFFGGGALFFAKPRSEVEVINDIDQEVINFYAVVKKDFKRLQKEIRATLHSRTWYNKARAIYQQPQKHTELERAWAFWTLANQGFASMLTSWGFGRENSKEVALARKRDSFTRAYAERFKMVQIESNDVLMVIDRCDASDSFFYVDPPYINSDQGHYEGYTEKEYTSLLEKLTSIKGKFLLSSYPSSILNKFVKKYKWKVKKVKMAVAVTKHTDKEKTEVMVFNFDPPKTCIYEPEKMVKTINIKQLTKKLKQLKFTA
jgi:DNA adenine methylase